ncbi:MAG TPA: phytanoyl-CoA dioxygenase family protein [Chlamydiales bacterium]|nr:phytanoyl-CoA dioxygenase family protein [Chlamydiales bacterium]
MFLFLLACALTDFSYWNEKKTQFEDQGYVWIKGYYSPEQVMLLRAWSDLIADQANALLAISETTGQPLKTLQQNIPGSLIVVPEAKDPHTVCRAEDLLTCYPDLYRFVYGTLTSYLSCLFGEPYTLFKDKINFKWPGGGAFPPHQDFPAFEFFGPREHITAMVCIDEATIENGCLQMAQNWKGIDDERINQIELQEGKAILPYIVGGPSHGTIKKEICDKIHWLPILAQPGDVVFFNSYVPHYSETNQSNAPRRAMFFTHNRLSEGDHKLAYYHTKRNDPDNRMFHFGTPTKARNK